MSAGEFKDKAILKEERWKGKRVKDDKKQLISCLTENMAEVKKKEM